MSAITFDEEELTDEFITEITPLTEAHWREVAHYQDIPLSVVWGAYKAAQEAGKLVIYTAREDTNLVGYAFFVVDYNVHYSTSLQAKQDVLFLAPSHRGKGTGKAFIAFADQGLAARGVQCVYHHVKFSLDFGPLLQEAGYEKIEAIWGRRLDITLAQLWERRLED